MFTDPQQEFYIQVSETEPFGIIKLSPKTGVRVVENLTIEPVTKETDEEINSIDIIIQEMAKGGLYKIWAQNPLVTRRICGGAVHAREDEHADLGLRD